MLEDGWASPATRFALCLASGLATAALLATLAYQQPRFGLTFADRDDRITVTRPDDRGGSPEVVGIRTPRRIVALRAEDLTPEPDVLPSFGAMDAFFDRQARIATALQGPAALLLLDRRRLVERPLVPANAIPFAFWQQLLIGLCGFAISAWVWSIAPRRLANILFGLSGVAMLAFVGTAAVYSTRELATDGRLFAILSAGNLVGASVFGVAMTCLFLVYPRRLVPPAALLGIAIVFGAWAAAALVRLLPSPAIGGHLATTIEMALIALAIGWQFVATRGDPVGRAALRWVGTSTLLGAGLFIATNALPVATGGDPLVDQGWAFGFFLLIHLGVAIGLRRDRLFAMDRWALGLLFYGGVTFLFVIIDTLLVIALGSVSAAAAATGVILLPLLYLPLRDRLARRLIGRSDIAETLERVARVALAPTAVARAALWRSALDRAFAPLEIEPGVPGITQGPAIEEEGQVLLVPAIGDGPPLRLRLARRGRALFKPSDERLAARMVDLASQVYIDRRAYERGVDTERLRVARDLHDDLAAKLMSGLALDDAERLRATLRSALAEVRSIVNATLAGPAPLVDILADSRTEAAERLEAGSILLDWEPDVLAGTLDADAAKALTSALREITTNVLRHSQASAMSVFARTADGWLHLRVEDDGRTGLAPPLVLGNGLRNIVQRMKMAGGRAEHEFAPGGFRMTLALPVAM